MGFSVALMLVAVALDTATANELSWRRGRSPSQRSVTQADTQPRGRSHAASPTHRDGAVRLVQYEVVAGPSLGSDDRQLHSLVVERNEQADDVDRGQVRAAQLQWGSSEPDSRYEEQIRTPFGDDPAEGSPDLEGEMDQDLSEDLFPPLDEPADEVPTPSDEELSLPPSTDGPRAPAATGQPRRDPTVEPPRPVVQPPRTFQQPRQQPPRGRTGGESPEAEPLPTGTDGYLRVPGRRGTTTAQPQTDEDRLAEEFAAADDVSCSEELDKLQTSTLHDVDLAISVAGVAGEDYPVECSIDDGTGHPGRCWPQTVYMWKASALCHKPLYFEDESLERYGHSWGPCCDPIVSGAHFFSKLAVLPYCMGLAPPCECQYALGHYRPGSCAPYMCDPIPITSRAALMQAGAVVGTAALLP